MEETKPSNRATDLSSLTKEQLQGLTTGYLKCKRHLSVFDKRAGKVAKCRNYKFTEKSIHNDVMLYKCTQGMVDPSTKLVTKLLEEREAMWTDIQKKKMAERIEEKLKGFECKQHDKETTKGLQVLEWTSYVHQAKNYCRLSKVVQVKKNLFSVLSLLTLFTLTKQINFKDQSCIGRTA